ncbi:MAG: polysaccharide export protein [Verrucomicrobia bacterium]|nr:polysaccharide export protein [Verrucomicrobiota bacterium]
MNARLILKAIALLAVAILAGGWLGCAWLGKPKIEPGKEFKAPTTPDPIAAASRMRIGDTVTVRLDLAAGREEHIKTVDEYGNIELPFIGKVHLVDMTVTQAQEDVFKRYVPKYYAYLTVTVQSQTPRVIYLQGEVRAAAPLPYREDMTVMRVIMTAGGFTDFADKRHVVLTRGDKQMVVDCIDLDRHPEKDIPLQPADTLKIPRMMF